MTTETEKLPSIVSSVLIPRKDKNVKEALDQGLRMNLFVN